MAIQYPKELCIVQPIAVFFLCQSSSHSPSQSFQGIFSRDAIILIILHQSEENIF